ncbi:MAG TPA: hypothetical protein VHC22_17990 [Pirellulales bacterium]|nr:hypothetical protein [Pirellulales bacterium]
MAVPSQDPVQQSFHKWMCKYLVPMVARFESFNLDGSPLDKTLLIFSGFILRVHNLFFWATAGHCINDFEDLLRHPHVRIQGISLADCFGEDAVFRESIPFPYAIGDAFRIHDEGEYLDFALVRLSGNLCEQLAVNGVTCVSRGNWSKPDDRRFFHHIVLGFPESSVDDQRRRGFMQPVGVAIDALDPDELPDEDCGKWFVGKVRSDDIETIKGMSGGPIFGFWKDDANRTHFSIFALQSWWDKKTRIIRGCTLNMFAEVLHRHMEELAERFQMGAGDSFDPVL